MVVLRATFPDFIGVKFRGGKMALHKHGKKRKKMKVKPKPKKKKK